MAITPKPGYIVDPNNPNGVIRADSVPSTTVSNLPVVNPNADYFSKNNQTPATPTTPTPTPTQAPTPSQYYPRMTTEPTPVVAETAEQIQERKIKNAQGLIDNLNKFYDTEIEQQTKINVGRERGTNAISTLTGLAGSTEAEVAIDRTKTANQKEINAINQQRAVAISGILTKISDSAVEEAKQSRLEARQSAQDILAYREKAQTDAVNYLTALSKSSPTLTIEGLKATLTPEEYNYIAKNVGGEAMIKATIFEARPKNTILGTPQLIGGKMVQAYTTPDGKVVYESIDLPEGVVANQDNIKSIEKTDSGIFIINKDGTWSTIKGSGAIKSTTQADKTSNVISQYTAAFTPGVKLADGTPTISPDGFATFTAWKEAIKEAPTKGITRADFIRNFGHLLLLEKDETVSPPVMKIPSEYGLTKVEKRLILGVQSDDEDGA